MKRRKPLNKISQRRLDDMLHREYSERIRLCERVGGHFKATAWLKGTPYFGVCIGGYCEKCGKPGGKYIGDFNILRPHEWKLKRSLGGKVSVENSLMLHNTCHNEEEK